MSDFRKKILFIELFKFSGAPTGLITELEEIIKHQDYEPILICTKGSILEAFVKKQKIKSLILSQADNINHSKFLWVKAFLRTSLFFLRVKPSIIHVNHYEWLRLGVALGILLGVPVIIHLKDVYDIESRISRFIFTVYSKTYYIAVSSYVEKLFYQRYKLPPDRVRIIFDGISPEFIKKINPFRSIINNNIHIVGTVSRIAPDRGIKEFIETASFVIKSYPRVKFVFAGVLEKDIYLNFPEFSDLINGLKIKKYIEFRPYMQDRAVLKDYYQSLDVFFISAPQFALPNAAIEAMLMGKPIVAAKVGGIPEIITHMQNGILVPYPKPLLFAEAIVKLLKDQKLKYKLGNRAKKDASKKFLSNLAYPQLLDFYRYVETVN